MGLNWNQILTWLEGDMLGGWPPKNEKRWTVSAWVYHNGSIFHFFSLKQTSHVKKNWTKLNSPNTLLGPHQFGLSSGSNKSHEPFRFHQIWEGTHFFGSEEIRSSPVHTTDVVEYSPGSNRTQKNLRRLFFCVASAPPPRHASGLGRG